MKLRLYHLANSRSQRIVWLLEELQADYNLVFSDEVVLTDLPNSVLPLKYPTLSVKTLQNEYVLTETTSVAEFLVSHFNLKLAVNSSCPNAFLNYLFWKNYSDASLMPNVALKQIFAQITQKTPFIFRPISWSFKLGFNKGYLDSAFKEQLQRVNDHLENNHWISGPNLTIADILMWFPLEACMQFSNTDSYTHLKRYMEQIHQHPSFQKALQKGRWSSGEFERYWNV